MSLADTLQSLENASDLQTEYSLLKLLQKHLTTTENTQLFFNNQHLLDQFIPFLFNRRFGWSDGDHPLVFNSTRSNSTATTTTATVPPSPNRYTFEDETKHKKVINETADEFIHFLREQPISSCLLDSATICASKALKSNKPVVRQQILTHVFEWIKIQIESDEKQHRNRIAGNFDKIKVTLSR